MTKQAPIPLVEQLRQLAVADPKRIAVTTEDGDISRGELEYNSDARARELVPLGVRPGDFVCLVLPNGVEFVSALVAVGRAAPYPFR